MPDQSSAATEHAILQEITRPLEALPDDPLSVVAADFPTALRGYDRMAVDEYVRRTRQLVAELQATRSPESAVRRALERVGEEITGILQRAHETAEQITAQSRSEAEDRLEQARREAAQVAGAAEERVRELDADTDRIWLERQRIVADAEELAGQLLALAKTAADRFPADSSAETASGPVYDEDEGPADEDASAAFPAPPAYEPGTDDEELAGDEDDLEPREEDDVEETVAFQPVRPSDPGQSGEAEESAEPGDADQERAAAPEDAADDEDDEPTAERPPDPDAPADQSSAGSEDATAVIPPASQAANRRRQQ